MPQPVSSVSLHPDLLEFDRCVGVVGSHEAVAAVKQAILWGMLLLVPAMAAAGGTGFKLLGSRTDSLALAKGVA